jgi:hypothetical protein
MTLRDFLRELVFPLESSQTLIALLLFVALIALAGMAGLFGLWLMIAVVPAFLRYLTMIAEARARDDEADPPGIEYFTLVGNGWTLFPVVPVLAMAYIVVETGQAFGAVPAIIVALGFVALLPAMIGVLIITQSPLQSLDPRAIGRFIRGCSDDYWYAPATAVLVVLVPSMLSFLETWLQVVVEVYALAAFFAVTGAVTRGARLFEDVELPEASEPDVDKVLDLQEGQRVKVLNHAYGFISRGNRDGGLNHIYDWLARDPDPDGAWTWFFDQMMRWEDSYPGLLLAQQYVGRLLELGDDVGAVKLMLRCRLINGNFRPLSADLPRAIAAAKTCRNDALVQALSR